MRWTRWVTWIGCSLAIGAAVSITACGKGGGHAGSADADKIARGKRLAWTSGCNDCHTPGSMYGAPDTTRLLSGSELGWSGPWGVSYPRNLTPDPTTGVGSWTEQQIVAAIRQGRKPDGTALLPPMPWPSFAHMTDDDAYAIAAYLKSIPPVEHKVPDAIRPGDQITGSVVVFPPPSDWDAKNLPPPPSAPTQAPGGGVNNTE